MTDSTKAPDGSYRIAPARLGDETHLARLIHELATYEKLAQECRVTAEDLRREIFGPRPSVEV